jgi:hypothetical protein
MSKSWEQIIGGYATDTLTEEEKRQLFEVALHDQTLFDALADEEALKALLADPEARQRTLASLQESGNPQETARSHTSWLRWFRQPSSLAWAGSIAAAGLALIFGWQMEKDWGSLIQQEQEAERSLSENKDGDKNEEVFRSQQAQLEDQKPAVALEKKDEGLLPSEVKPQSVLAPMPEADTHMAKSIDRLGQVQGALEEETQVKVEALDSSSPIMQEQVSQASDMVSESSEPQVTPAIQSLAMPDSAEVAKPESATPTRVREQLTDQAVREKSPPQPGALDLFYAELGPKEGADSHSARTDADDPTGKKGVSKPSIPNAKEKNRVSTQGERTGGEAVLRRAKGIRYSFVRETEDGDQEMADGQQIPGDWRNVRLAIEPNEAGFLYVMAPVGKGKWQQLEGMTLLKSTDNPDSGSVEAHQIVEFRLSAITNRMGNLVISSITVLLSPSPLENFGRWLGGNVDMSGLQIENTDDTVYVVQPGAVSGMPLRVDITLEE